MEVVRQSVKEASWGEIQMVFTLLSELVLLTSSLSFKIKVRRTILLIIGSLCQTNTQGIVIEKNISTAKLCIVNAPETRRFEK